MSRSLDRCCGCYRGRWRCCCCRLCVLAVLRSPPGAQSPPGGGHRGPDTSPTSTPDRCANASQNRADRRTQDAPGPPQTADGPTSRGPGRPSVPDPARTSADRPRGSVDPASSPNHTAPDPTSTVADVTDPSADRGERSASLTIAVPDQATSTLASGSGSDRLPEPTRLTRLAEQRGGPVLVSVRSRSVVARPLILPIQPPRPGGGRSARSGPGPRSVPALAVEQTSTSARSGPVVPAVPTSSGARTSRPGPRGGRSGPGIDRPRPGRSSAATAPVVGRSRPVVSARPTAGPGTRGRPATRAERRRRLTETALASLLAQLPSAVVALDLATLAEAESGQANDLGNRNRDAQRRSACLGSRSAGDRDGVHRGYGCGCRREAPRPGPGRPTGATGGSGGGLRTGRALRGPGRYLLGLRRSRRVDLFRFCCLGVRHLSVTSCYRRL
ncbi:hypothetical protein HOU95_gp068 [Streptomyces phage Hiyaa]|uniref:Uncharacterized protein n=1 Tax=Streptomyces phage Hiyaa TaxID=2499072 RepID=A0A3S9U952_9CAUD|nr:hypothetical protein HOU95_gp068 [Streptomyces phage Hiyaa]AZS06739.1 hypothetical protein SEA_HIYAA_100 [Streptomyces phage Hiyaa]